LGLGLGFRVQGLGFRVQGSGFRVSSTQLELGCLSAACLSLPSLHRLGFRV
jgi:hypothetical protein